MIWIIPRLLVDAQATVQRVTRLPDSTLVLSSDYFIDAVKMIKGVLF